MDERAQITIDYIAGITIFLTTLFFLYYFISGAFVPFQSSSDEVTLMADRVAVQLVEDKLAAHPGEPNVIPEETLEEFMAGLDDDYGSTTEGLGLNGSYRQYGLNVTIEYMNQSRSSEAAGPSLPSFRNVGQTKRAVLIKTDYGREVAMLAVRVW